MPKGIANKRYTPKCCLTFWGQFIWAVFLTSVGKRLAGNCFWPIGGLTIVGFAHTHPVGKTNRPSGPDIWMKRLGWIVSLRIFPITVYNNKKDSINYF